MQKVIVTGIVMTLISCYPNRGNVIYPLGERDILLFLNSDEWMLKEVCVDKDCQEISDEEYPFGIETSKVVPNYCTKEKGDFYTIGKYYWQTNPETYENSKIIFSDPDYFKISKFGQNGNEIEIKLCTPNGYYSGVLKIVDGSTIKIIANRPEYDKKEVVQVYKKK